MYTGVFIARRLRSFASLAALGAAAGLLALAAPARADEPAKDEPAKDEAAEKKDGAGKDDGAKAASPSSPREDPLKRYYFLGARFRDVVLPQFMMELFAKGGATGNVWLVGPELTTRKDGTEVDISLTYADYGFGPAMFKGKDDADLAYEMVKSDLKIVYLNFDLLIDFPLDKEGMFSFLIGGGVGVGVVAGDLYHVQSYPKGGGAPDPTDPSKWEKCAGPDDPNGVVGGQQYCDTGNSRYPTNGKDYSEPSWADGGSKPIVVPWLSIPQISFRAKPIKQLQIRADVGFSITGFFFGLSSGYGF